jgi:hypothetical protein
VIVVDVAGGEEVGAARFRGEFDRYLAGSGRADVRAIGRQQRLTPAWLARRELARSAATGRSGPTWAVTQNTRSVTRCARCDQR